MTLMTLVRSIAAVAILWTLAALGIGATGARLAAPEAPAPVPFRPTTVEAMPTDWPLGHHHELIDRESGRRAPLRLPEVGRWSNVSVSPSRGPGGEAEAAGRWVDLEGEHYCGWGLFRISDGAVLGRVETEILPLGRPCWVPGHPRTIVFPAGDGRLYRCRLDAPDEPPGGGPSVYATGRREPSEPVAWEAPIPGSGEVYLDHPVWPDDPKLRKWIIAGLRCQEGRNGRPQYRRSQLWWLEMSEDARAIVAAGRLTVPIEDEERFPAVADGPDGSFRLFYLARSPGETPWRVRSARLGIDPGTGRPSASPGRDLAPPGDFRAAPLLASEDGETVYGVSRAGGIAALRDKATASPE